MELEKKTTWKRQWKGEKIDTVDVCRCQVTLWRHIRGCCNRSCDCKSPLQVPRPEMYRRCSSRLGAQGAQNARGKKHICRSKIFEFNSLTYISLPSYIFDIKILVKGKVLQVLEFWETFYKGSSVYAPSSSNSGKSSSTLPGSPDPGA